MTTALPGAPRSRRAIWLAIVPDGTNTAASFPTVAAYRASRRLTVGSSPYPSSPTSASAIAFPMASEGRVTVSLRRSIICPSPYGVAVDDLIDGLHGLATALAAEAASLLLDGMS